MGTVITKQSWYEVVDNFNIIQFWGELIKKHSGHLRSCVIFGQLNWLYDSQIAVNLNFSHDKKYANRTIGNICWRRLPSGKFMTIKYEFDLGHFFHHGYCQNECPCYQYRLGMKLYFIINTIFFRNRLPSITWNLRTSFKCTICYS